MDGTQSVDEEPLEAASAERAESFNFRQFRAGFLEVAIHLGFIAFLAYWTFVLVRPFLPIMVWSVVLTVALYPVFSWLAAVLGGRRKLAAALITVVGLLIVIGPATWLGLGLIDALRTLIARLDSGKLIPPPSEAIKAWPLIGQQLYDYWALASTNVRSALAYLLPQLQAIGSFLLDTMSTAGTGMLNFLVSVIIAGFLFSPGPALVNAMRKIAFRIDPAHGGEFLELAGATIRVISRGVIGISVLQAVIGGIAMSLAAVPGASLLTLAILVLGIVQIGSFIVVAPLVVWGWATMATVSALAFTICMAAVLFLENFLKPFVMTRGLATPKLVTLIGVIGGVLAYGIAGLFIGPMILAVAWDLADAWVHDKAPVR